jgi:hypothetical protein
MLNDPIAHAPGLYKGGTARNPIAHAPGLYKGGTARNPIAYAPGLYKGGTSHDPIAHAPGFYCQRALQRSRVLCRRVLEACWFHRDSRSCRQLTFSDTLNQPPIRWQTASV